MGIHRVYFLTGIIQIKLRFPLVMSLWILHIKSYSSALFWQKGVTLKMAFREKRQRKFNHLSFLRFRSEDPNFFAQYLYLNKQLMNQIWFDMIGGFSSYSSFRKHTPFWMQNIIQNIEHISWQKGVYGVSIFIFNALFRQKGVSCDTVFHINVRSC